MPTDAATPTKMTYRFLGNSGLLVSKMALGSWMTVDDKHTAEAWYEMMEIAFKAGVNFYDNAEVYGNGQAEEIMGTAIQRGIADGVWSREDLVVTTKVFMGAKGWEESGPNAQGISRKHIVEGAKASLRRMQLNYVDVIFCHRPEPYTPIEETVRTMNYVIQQGWAFYWGTSEWNATDIVEACDVADRLGLIHPIVEQAQYSLMESSKVEFEFAPLYKKYKLGLTTWAHSPTAFSRANTVAAWPKARALPIPSLRPCSVPRSRTAWRRLTSSRSSRTNWAARWRSSLWPGASPTRTCRLC
ncbi:hypothetical protein PF008_g8124 [Phytophthora fragariae]|uniref:NADP-dependent oxidoreductase domain-containing protein n=1 Tax=Phytophthora fragariae TaxID=53985 RepID=A0A6G0S105_9STRA|nr:hypothetical protein PF008_g8124 [Phytophthora fragariae]